MEAIKGKIYLQHLKDDKNKTLVVHCVCSLYKPVMTARARSATTAAIVTTPQVGIALILDKNELTFTIVIFIKNVEKVFFF